MTGLIAKLVFNKILHENSDNKNGTEDPYFETVPAGRLSVGGRTKRRKKALPPGLSREDEKTLVKVKRRAYRLDMALGSFCGMKIGWSSLIAIIPGIGDVLDMLLALMVIRTASQAKLPSSVTAQMMFNVIIDFVIGLVPFLGDIADIAFKANTRNAIVLEIFLRERGAENIRRQGLPQQPDPSLGDNYDRYEQQEVNTQQPGAQTPPSYQRGGFLGGLFGDGTRVDDVEAQRASASVPSSSRQHSTRHGSSRHGSSKHGSSRHGPSRHGSSRHGSSRHESRGHSSRNHGQSRRGEQESGTTGGRSGR
ncbi:hypothetical protein L873DRAFT_1688605 [Choiromyces venosus 120613-1]|uniref:PH domain-containing protein n=1 Tax=Choiromyces venosus 120613-1 TaxID=1336337 RepID=A0A3N4JLK5_9PEZI|nr:hypothetical protein L873DRAFT_1688605 [Choiromyces venosus 120613-1]